MSERRGLTLIEVLLATALLGVLAAATLPLFASAPPPPETEAETELMSDAARVDRLELDQLADNIVGDPGAFDIVDLAAIDHHHVDWPGHPDRPPIVIERVTSDMQDVNAYWLVFRGDEHFVLRRVIEPEGEVQEP